MRTPQRELKPLLLRTLEQERGAIDLYETALRAIHATVVPEWQQACDRTREQEETLMQLCRAWSVDPEEGSPARQVARQLSVALVGAIRTAVDGEADAVARIAGECILLAQTASVLSWQSIAAYARQMRDPLLLAVADRAQPVADQRLAQARQVAHRFARQWLGLQDG